MKRHHYPFKAARDPKGHPKKKKKKKLLIFYGRHGTPWRPKNRGQLTGMTRPIKDEHIRKDDFAPVTNPGNAHVIDEYKTAI